MTVLREATELSAPTAATTTTEDTKMTEAEAPKLEVPQITVGTNPMSTYCTGITVDTTEDPFKDYGSIVHNLVGCRSSKNGEEEKEDKGEEQREKNKEENQTTAKTEIKSSKDGQSLELQEVSPIKDTSREAPSSSKSPLETLMANIMSSKPVESIEDLSWKCSNNDLF